MTRADVEAYAKGEMTNEQIRSLSETEKKVLIDEECGVLYDYIMSMTPEERRRWVNERRDLLTKLVELLDKVFEEEDA